jgi:hypothetical protein
VRSITVGAAALFFAAAGPAFAQAATPDVSHVMVIIAVSPTSTTHGVQMTVLTFPSERACTAAAAVFGQPVDGVTIVARCAPAR